MLLLAVAFQASLLGISGSAPPLTVHVSPHGHDSHGGGSSADPFATLTRARDAIRLLRKQGATEHARVVLACGRYSLVSQGCLELTGEDSNTTWASQTPSCWATLSGGVLVDAKAWKPAGVPGLWRVAMTGPSAVLIPANATRVLVNGRPRERVRTAVLHWNRTIAPSHGGVNTKCDLSQRADNTSKNCYGFIIDPA